MCPLFFPLSPRPSTDVYRSLLCIIKTLEQIFILFAIQLDRQFPSRLWKYLPSSSVGPPPPLRHFPPFSPKYAAKVYYLYLVNENKPMLFILPIDIGSLSSRIQLSRFAKLSFPSFSPFSDRPDLDNDRRCSPNRPRWIMIKRFKRDRYLTTLHVCSINL